MKSKIFLFGATEKDVEKLDALNAIISKSYNVESAGYVACFRFGLRCLQEHLANEAITYDAMKQEQSDHCKNFTIKFGPYEMATLDVVKSGLESISSNDLSRCSVLRISIECAGIWAEEHLKKAVDNNEYALRVMHAFAFCSQSGPGVGPSSFINSSEWLENFAPTEHK